MRVIMGVLCALLAWATVVAAQDITTSLNLWWKLNDGSGTTAADSGSGGHPGTLGAAPAAPTWTTGCQLTGCLSFDGGDSVHTTGTPNLVTGGSGTVWTISLWVKIPTMPPAALTYLVTNWSTSLGNAQYILKVNTTGTLEFDWCGGSFCTTYVYAITTQTTLIPANTWTHVAWVNTSDSYTGQLLYVNGAPITITNAGHNGFPFVPTSNFGDTYIGIEDDGAGGCICFIDDVRLYTRALTSGDMTALYAFTEGTAPRRNRGRIQ